MPTQSSALSPEAARSAFEDLVVKLFFELEAECRLNATFALPAWIAPTFAAAQQAYAAWNQAVDALPTDTSEKGPIV
jgi:hypothetical protein